MLFHRSPIQTTASARPAWPRLRKSAAALALAVAGAIIEFMNMIDDNLAIPWGLTLVILLLNEIAPNLLFTV